MKSFPAAIVTLCSLSLLLAWEPLTWLWRTWTDPTWSSDGEWVAVAVVGVALWSWRSPLADEGTPASWTWLGVSAVVRAAGNFLAVNVLSALMLAVDVWALGRVLRLDERRRHVSSFLLGVAFLFSLPVERIVQRLVGYPLQWLAARGAWALLHVTFEDVALSGVELTVRGARVLVDLPCSGARSLSVLVLAYVVGASLVRMRPVALAMGSLAALALAGLSNVLRIYLLAVGIVWGWPVMQEPWHSLVGLVCLSPALWALFHIVRGLAGALPGRAIPVLRPPTPWMAAAMVAVGLVSIAWIQPRPLDVSEPVVAPQLPRYVGGEPGRPSPLSRLEASYFTAWGGGAARAHYGANTLLVVRTSSPLRHLHNPEECMAGAGWDVERVGITGRRFPGATWIVRRGADALVVRATYVSSRGDVVTTLEEAISAWLLDPTLVWTAIERAYPLSTNAEAQEAFDREVFHRLKMEVP